MRIKQSDPSYPPLNKGRQRRSVNSPPYQGGARGGQGRLVCAVVFLLGVILFPLKLTAEDFQLWINHSWSQNFDYGLQPSLRFEPRFENDVSDFSYYEIEAMLNWRYSPRWDFAIAYERDERLLPDTEISHVPNISSTLKLPLRNWFVSNLFRFEFMLPESDEDSRITYRNRTQLEYRRKFGSKEIVPFVFEEWFLDLNEVEIVQNRAGIGIGYPVVPHWIIQAYFMRLDEKVANEWNWHPVFGIQLLAQF
jgi:hypothetical protein